MHNLVCAWKRIKNHLYTFFCSKLMIKSWFFWDKTVWEMETCLTLRHVHISWSHVTLRHVHISWSHVYSLFHFVSTACVTMFQRWCCFAIALNAYCINALQDYNFKKDENYENLNLTIIRVRLYKPYQSSILNHIFAYKYWWLSGSINNDVTSFVIL